MEFIGTGNYLDTDKTDFLLRNIGAIEPGALLVGSVGNGAAHFTNIGGVGPEWNFHDSNPATRAMNANLGAGCRQVIG